MASIPLTLAALATSAVSGLTVTGTRELLTSDSDSFTTALLHTDGPDVIVRIPKHPQAEVQISSEILGLDALSDGARELLPVSLPETLGITRAGDSRAVVTTFVAGHGVRVQDISADALLIASLSETMTAIHQLPVLIAQRNGLPVLSAGEVRDQALRTVARAAQTHLLPETIHRAWKDFLRLEEMWDFDPCVIHGSLAAEQLRVENDVLVGVLGWDALSVADPASDFMWLLESGPETLESVLAHYSLKRGVSSSRALSARARFYHQLEVAKWLLHGMDSHDQTIIDDAVAMLDLLVDRMGAGVHPVVARVPLGESGAESLLDDTPENLPDPRSETAEYESLDEDRMFEFSDDFGDAQPLTAESVDSASPSAGELFADVSSAMDEPHPTSAGASSNADQAEGMVSEAAPEITASEHSEGLRSRNPE